MTFDETKSAWKTKKKAPVDEKRERNKQMRFYRYAFLCNIKRGGRARMLEKSRYRFFCGCVKLFIIHSNWGVIDSLFLQYIQTKFLDFDAKFENFWTTGKLMILGFHHCDTVTCRPGFLTWISRRNNYEFINWGKEKKMGQVAYLSWCGERCEKDTWETKKKWEKSGFLVSAEKLEYHIRKNLGYNSSIEYF